MSKMIARIWEVDGEIVVVGPDDQSPGQTPIDPDQYDENGFSIEMKHGCVRHKAVDEYLAAMAIGDEFQRDQAKTAPRWFAVFIDRDYDEVTRKLLIRNYQQDGGAPSFISGNKVAMSQQFYPIIERDLSDTRPPFTYNYGEALEGFATLIAGPNPYAMKDNFGEKAIASMAKDLDAARFRAKFPPLPPSPTPIVQL